METGSVEKRTRPANSLANIEAMRVSLLLDEIGLGDTWFQHDGVTAHTSKASAAVL